MLVFAIFSLFLLIIFSKARVMVIIGVADNQHESNLSWLS